MSALGKIKNFLGMPVKDAPQPMEQPGYPVRRPPADQPMERMAPGFETLGGHSLIPQDAPPSNELVNTTVAPRPIQPPSAVPAQPTASAVPYPQKSDLQRRADVLLNKDYSITKDAEGNVISRGKDRDAKWSLKDKIGSTALGILDGLMRGGPLGALAGGISAGTDRNYLEKLEDQKEANQVFPRLKQEQENQAFEQNQQHRQTQIDNIGVDNRRMQDDLLRKSAADQNKAKYYDGMLKEKKLTREQVGELQRERIRLIEEGNVEKARQFDAKIAETIRNNNLVDEDRNLSREQKGAIAGKGMAQKQQQFVQSLQQKIQSEAQKGVLDKAKYTRGLAEDLQAGKITAEMFNALMQFLK